MRANILELIVLWLTVVDDIPRQRDVCGDFDNLNDFSAQSLYIYAYRNRVYMRSFIWLSVRDVGTWCQENMSVPSRICLHSFFCQRNGDYIKTLHITSPDYTRNNEIKNIIFYPIFPLSSSAIASLKRRSQSAILMHYPTTNPKTFDMPQDPTLRAKKHI
jgi:hypothetical protein